MLIIDRNLDISLLARGKMHCTSFGKAAGDFHFVMEHKHAEALFRLHYPTGKAPLNFHGHGWMRKWMALSLGEPEQGVVANDDQLFGGMDEEVFRKTDFTQMLCNGFPYWQAFWAAYGMTDRDWDDQRALLHVKGRECPKDRPLFAIHRMCCGLETCETRSASKGACCVKSKHGLHHCLHGPD